MLVLIYLIFLLFFCGIIISSKFLKFSSIIGFAYTILLLYDLVTALAISFSKNSPVASAALWTTFLEAVFDAFVPVSNN